MWRVVRQCWFKSCARPGEFAWPGLFLAGGCTSLQSIVTRGRWCRPVRWCGAGGDVQQLHRELAGEIVRKRLYVPSTEVDFMICI